MKKITVAITALASIGIFAPCAGAEAVYSENVVGYTKINATQGLNILGGQFITVGGGNLNIQKITSEDLTGGDTAQFWNGTSYTTVFYYGVNNEGGVYDTDEETCLGPGWGDINQIVVNRAINAGEGFWIQAGAASTVTISGEITSSAQVSLSSGLNLVANPVPAAINVSEISAVGLEGGDTAQFWNGSSYTTVFYYGLNNEGGVYDTDEETCLGPGWGDINQIVVSMPIVVGQGFWIQSAGDGTLKFPSPILNNP
jgi:hypothetical protein